MSRHFFILFFIFCTLFPALSLFADEKISDPLEKINRATYRFNRGAETVFLRPVSRLYLHIPLYGRNRVRNVTRWVGKPLSMINSLFQLDIENAARDLMSFTLNGTIGVFGLFDLASPIGLDQRDEDFGQTLGRYGVGPKPYLVLPVLGPSTARDSTGFLVDYQAERSLIEKSAVNFQPYMTGLALLGAIDSYSRVLEALTALEKSSLDPYIGIQSFYLQSRENAILNITNDDAAGRAARASGATEESIDDFLDDFEEENF